MTASSYESKTNDELSEELKSRGLPFTGVKAELVARLESDDSVSNPVIHDDNIDRDNDINDAPEAIRTDLKGDPTTTTPRSKGDKKDPPDPSRELPHDSDGEEGTTKTKTKKKGETFQDHRMTPEFAETAYARPGVLLHQTGQVETGTGGYVDHSSSVGVINGIVPSTVTIEGDHVVIPDDTHEKPTTPYIVIDNQKGEGKLVTPKNPPRSPLQPQAQAYGESQVATPVVPVSGVPTAQPDPALESVKANTVAMDTQVTYPIVLEVPPTVRVVYGPDGPLENVEDFNKKREASEKKESKTEASKTEAKKSEPVKETPKTEAPKTEAKKVEPVKETPKTEAKATPAKSAPQGSIKEDDEPEETKVEGTFIGAIKENDTNE